MACTVRSPNAPPPPHAESAIYDSPQLAKPVKLQRGWVRRALWGIIIAEVVAVLALVMFNDNLQAWTKELWNRASSAITGSSTAGQPAEQAPPAP